MPVAPEPFALIVARMDDGGEAGFMGALRRMGLRPEPVTTKDRRAEAPLVRVRFGSTSALIGRASADTLGLADPLHPLTSQLASRLDETWRDAGRVWAVIPEAEGGDTAGDLAVRLREYFKAMVLLIDLFDASHIFWAPARLWTDAPQFRDAIAEMLASGMPPVLHLVAFRRSDAPGADAGSGRERHRPRGIRQRPLMAGRWWQGAPPPRAGFQRHHLIPVGLLRWPRCSISCAPMALRCTASTATG